MIEHCINALKAKREDQAYRAYVTDALRLISENTAKYAGGSYIKARFVEIAGYGDNRKKKMPHKEETAEEVINRIASRLGAI